MADNVIARAGEDENVGGTFVWSSAITRLGPG